MNLTYFGQIIRGFNSTIAMLYVAKSNESIIGVIMVDKSPERNVDGKASHGILRESWQPHYLHYKLEHVPFRKEAIALGWKDTKLYLDGKLFNA